MTAWTDSVSGQTIVVTGANSGIGYAATKAFVARGADVVLACRSIERGEAAVNQLRTDVSDGSATVLELDLADLDSIRAFVQAFETAHDELDVLCNNAGVMAIPRSETADGFETQFGVNHLGHFALTGLLLETLLETEGETRIVTQSSAVHEQGRIDFEDLHHEDSYNRWTAYSQSKLANLLFAYELQRRLDRADIEDLVSVACHPGYAATNLQKRGPEQSGSALRLWLMKAANALIAQSPEQGALPMLYAATETDVRGAYVGPDGVRNMRGHPEPQRSSDRSYDEATAERLWSVSEELTGVTYGFDGS
ncbi:oxidoreductase [Halocatena salina]|uniref:Oxidoreductase n=1 Tax=Halocatena salina TaxID=2934340 RepID=A0A8T9ZZ26_9EURY|nr:oxidoreductase [Halocatena salina]UPM42022.1 oxidoreductase [Halocatena salina]